jgi:small subunit ribosomal protein S13
MAEQAKEQKRATEQKAKPEKRMEKKASIVSKEMPTGRIIRILQTDIPGNKNVYAGLTRIKGVSWSISNALCILAKLDKNKKVETLTKEEIQKIEETLKKYEFPRFLFNRKNDFATGKDSHIFGSDINLHEELDIKRLKKIRSWRGWRHALGQPTRGQATKSHFRVNRKKGVGVKSKKPALGVKV